MAIRKNLEWLRKLSQKRRRESGTVEHLSLESVPTLEEFLAEFEETSVKPEEECRNIAGCVLWEIFSDNHSVIADDGREIDLGSFRGAGSKLDAFDRGDIEEESGMEDWIDIWDRGDYMRFYCGLAFIAGHTD